MADKKPTLNLAGMSPEQIEKAVNKHYGENTIVVADKARGLRVDFFSWGCYEMDYAWGGGVPENRVVQIHGPYSSLKTTLGYSAIANFQRKNSKNICVLMDLEKSHDPAYCDLLGVDSKRLYIGNFDSGEQAVDVLAAYCTVDFNVLVVIDSVAAIIPTAEIEASADQQTVGIQARLVNKMMRILTARVKRSLYTKKLATTTVICNNQIREKVGVMYGSPETTPGGRGKDFAYSVMGTVRSGSSSKILVPVTRYGIKKNRRVGQVVNYAVQKNKVSGTQFEEGQFEYYVRPHRGYPAFSFNNADAAIRMGRYQGVVRIKNVPNPRNKKTTIEHFRYGTMKGLTEDEFRLALIADLDTLESLHLENLRAIALENQGKEDEDTDAEETEGGDDEHDDSQADDSDDDDDAESEDDDDEAVVVSNPNRKKLKLRRR